METVALEECLGWSMQQSYPPMQRSSLVAPPCSDSVERIGSQAIAGILDRAGEERFLIKSEQFEGELLAEQEGQVLYEGFMRALGYAKNKEPFHDLARVLPLCVVERLVRRGTLQERVVHIQTLLFGTAGLLSGQISRQGDVWEHKLEQLWQQLGADQKMRRSRWRLFRVRPENLPSRRLAAASHVLARYAEDGLFEGMLYLVERALSRGDLAALRQGVVVRTRGYWANHFDFGVQSRWSPTILGRWRADDIVVNVLFPFYHAWAGTACRKRLKADILKLYKRYPQLGENWITRYVAGEVFGETSPKIVNSAQRQQGLIHLYRTFCVDLKCVECPIMRAG